MYVLGLNCTGVKAMSKIISDTKEKREPAVISNGLTVEEIFDWMQEKINARSLVITLENEMKSLDSTLTLNQERLSLAKSSASIDIVQK